MTPHVLISRRAQEFALEHGGSIYVWEDAGPLKASCARPADIRFGGWYGVCDGVELFLEVGLENRLRLVIRLWRFPHKKLTVHGPWVAGQDKWRCGCNRCEYRVDFFTRDEAEEAARLHNAKKHGGQPKATVYVASASRTFFDHISDSDGD